MEKTCADYVHYHFIHTEHLLSVKNLIQNLPPSRSIGTAHGTGNETLLGSSSASVIINRRNRVRTCISSVIAHHSFTLGLARMRSISPSKSVPTYLNVAKRVRSLSKKMESVWYLTGELHDRLLHIITYSL